MKKIVLLFIFCILITGLFANLDKVIYQTKVSKLNALSIKYYNEWKQKHDEALIKAKLRDIPVTIDTGKGFMELSHFDESDHPIYHILHNSNAAITISTDHVYLGGGAGLNLDGNGILVRQWDGGAVRGTHQELTGRTTNGDSSTLNSNSYHSTHVGGTIMASGVQANAKGMAFDADLKYFDWTNDTAEMATEAGLGCLLSNHSYGFGRGWTWTGTWTWYGQASPGEDWNFGHYNTYSQEFDEIAYDAPFYLIVESAGNDRGDGPGTDPDHPDADGPYDCLADMAASKNVLTVAAVEDMTSTYSVPSDVVMSSFSSWGPCDDGRIKPDISANGTYLYSTYDGSDTDYNSISGTSMAAPSVTGSLALIQEHSDETDGVYLRSSTLKALTLHCADEAGSNDGPDYAFGWGLMNTERMANYISNDGIDVRIEELTLTNGGTYQVILPALGTEPLKATLCWTDPEGTPVALSLDPADPMLINDLDIRITRGGSTYYPWKLDRSSPASAATNAGDNSVDNVEQVFIASPTASENYTITITHKGTLVDDSGSTSSQQFGLIISGIESGYPLCDITNPSNSEVIEKGTIETITVSASDPNGTITNVKIYIDNALKVTDTSSPYEYVWDTGSETLDNHTIKAIALDNDLNETIKEITVSVANLPVNIFEDDFETDKLWSLSGEFERASPGGLGGNYGNADPSSAYGGTNVLGVDLSGTGTYSGDYETSLADRAYQAISPSIDCSDYNNVALSFYRWLNVEQPTYDHAYIDINNGSGWQQIWTNSSGIEDAAWSEQNFDISTYADGQATVQIRFCMGGSDTSWQYSGWNIDDLIISGESTVIPGYGEGDNISNPGEPAVIDVGELDIDGSSVNPDVSIDPDGDLGITVNVTVTDEVQGTTPVPNPDNVIISYAVDIIGTINGVTLDFDLEFTPLTDLDQIHWFNGTNWVVPNNVSWSTPDHVTFDLTLTDRNASTEIILSRDDPLPVSLSSFTAIYSNGSPIINWVTQSESDNIGWNIYRSISYNFGQAQILNLDLIPGNGTTSEPSIYSFTDEYEVHENSTYWYWIESISSSGETESFGPVSLTIISDGNDLPEIPMETALHQNFPNPFNPSTLISFEIKEGENGVLSIYNIKGQLIEKEEFEAGRHSYTWDANNHSSGIYLYKLQAKRYSKIMKMLLVK